MIKRKLLILAFCVLGSFGALASQAQAQLKVGTLDLNRVFTEYYKTKDAEQKINEQRAAAKKEFDARVESLKTMMDDINKLNADLEKQEISPDTRDTKTKTRDQKISEARNLDRDINEFKEVRERQLQDQFLRMRKDLIDDIMKVVNAQVTKVGYDLVFDKSGLSMGQVPVVLYARDDFDFSKDVIATLNANAPKMKPTPTPQATPLTTPTPKKP